MSSLPTRAAPRDRHRWTRRGLTAAVSVGAHLLVFFALVMTQPAAPSILDPPPIEMTLEPPPKPEPKVEDPKPPQPKPKAPAAKAVEKKVKPVKPRKRTVVAKALKPSAVVRPLAAAKATSDDDGPDEPIPQLSEGQIAGASTAESGAGGGGACNMTRRLQAALRKDEAVQRAIGDAHRAGWTGGKPIWVWNGDWIRSPGADEGKGLAVVREAMIWEIGFAPPACKTDPMRGLVVISLSDAPGSPRIAVGPGEWRWADLLHSRGFRR